MSSAMLTSSLHSALPPTSRFNSGINRPNRTTGLFQMQKKRQPFRIFASCDRDKYNGKLVDEDMIVLRMRIHDMKMAEMHDDDHKAPENWMAWEKRYYPNYNSDVYEAVGLLQYQLMNTRPSVALGMLAIVALSVPISMGALMCPLLDIIKGILANGNIHF